MGLLKLWTFSRNFIDTSDCHVVIISRVQVKLENVFSTPLQLRRAHLLWRFTPAGSEESVTNGAGEDTAGSCVDTALVETVVLEPASTTEITFQVRLTVELSTKVREYFTVPREGLC